jgi:hypothetical protein
MLKFEVDTGAAVTVISEATWKSHTSLLRSEMLLKTYYTGEVVPVVGELRNLTTRYEKWRDSYLW